jgi:hypothetical protein
VIANALSVQGEEVRIGFDATIINPPFTTLTLYDQNNNVRILKAYERLIIDVLSSDGGSNGNAEGVYLLTTSSNIFTSSTILARLYSDFQTIGETRGDSVGPVTIKFEPTGLDCPLGLTPYVGSTTSAPVTLVGTGRIIVGSTQGKTPNWQASLNGRGPA